MDAYDVAAVVFFVSILGAFALFGLVLWIDSHNPMNRTRRMIDGRKAMATSWKRPDYLPGDWR